MLSPDELPPLDAEEAARSAQLAARIHQRANRQGGWLPFSEFMRAALYEPDLGYYMTDRPILGPAGDFTTAPELSPLFASCLANGLVDLLTQAGGGDIVEFGAGSGVMAAQVLATLARHDALPRRYRIVEPSPMLADRQRRWLERWSGTSALFDRFDWLDSPPAAEWQGVALANEVVDALPVDRFRIAGGGCEAIGVVSTTNGFGWQARRADAPLAGAVEALRKRLPVPLPNAFVSELRLGQRNWIAAATEKLTKGAMLVTDYGLPRAQYYHLSRNGGTLCGYRRHRRVEDVLATPGAQDLTAWVDFSALAEEASACGLDVGGFATQAHYLLSVGIERELARLLEGAEESDRVLHRQAAATLLLPGEMGERFKVLALTRGIDGPVAGFGFRDFTASL
ncbi:MAG: SAM-dependent methyltransferase [Steroidobacteraceae bacterium]